MSFTIVDRSIRIPVLFFFGSGVFWLVVASIFYLLSSCANPRAGRLVDLPWCSVVKFRPCLSRFPQLLCLRMGDLRGIGTGTLAAVAFQRVPSLRSPLFLILAGVVWNIGMIDRRPVHSGRGNDRQRVARVSARNGFHLVSRSGHGEPLGGYDDLEQEAWDDVCFAMVSSWGIFVVRLDVCDCEFRAWFCTCTRGCAAGDQLVVRRQFSRSLAHPDRLGCRVLSDSKNRRTSDL